MFDKKGNNIFSWFKKTIILSKRLHLVFWMIGGLIFTSTTFSAYFMHRLGEALEVTISQNMPVLTSALYLSEQSSMLSATAPVLAVSYNNTELSETSLRLEKMLKSIRDIIKAVPDLGEADYSGKLEKNTQIMDDMIIKLRESTALRLSLAERHAHALVEIQAVQRTLIEVLNPVEYGVISLTNLFGKRTVRRINRFLKQRNEKDEFKDSEVNVKETHSFISDEIDHLTEVAVKDMGYALTLKASGNNLINLLYILSEAETMEQIASLQSQYNSALAQFIHATEVFEQSALAQRNPVLSSNIYHISNQFQLLSQGQDNLFSLRNQQLDTKKSSQKFLEQTRLIAGEMSKHSNNLASHVDQRILSIQEEMEGKRKVGIFIITLVSGGCLVLTCFIAFGTIIAIKRQEEALQLSHDQLEHRVEKRTQELQQSYQQLAHAGRLTSLGEMATGIAHEINQPLNIINLATQVLKRYFKSYESEQMLVDSVNKIEHQVTRAATIIKNMRSFARTDSTTIESISIIEPAEMAISFFNEQFRLHQINISTDFSENLPRVKVDSQKFEQVVVNLLSNARHAVEEKADGVTREYQKQVDVKIYYNAELERVIFEIADNGIGMSSVIQEHCMEPFYTTKEVGQGTGLGMSISHNIITEFNGSIELESTEGEGSVFQILLPVTEHDR